MNAIMKKTVKDIEIENIYPVLDKAKYAKMDAQGRRQVFASMYAMKKVMTDYNGYQQELVKRLRPENAEEIARLVDEFNAMPQGGRESAIKEKKYADALKANYDFSTEVQKCLAEKESELDFAVLSDEAFDALCDSNPDWNFGQLMALREILCDAPEKASDGKEVQE